MSGIAEFYAKGEIVLTVTSDPVKIRTEYCDTKACPAKAAYHILFPRKKIYLTFCSHHYEENETSILGHVIRVEQ